jgi:hypothetical protein
MTYKPKIDDYIKWRNVEGWIYFVDDEYLTIEIAVKDKPDDFVSMHKKIHCLMVCYRYDWGEIEYIESRRYKNASNLDDMEIFVREF